MSEAKKGQTNNRGGKLANDPRWRIIDEYQNLISIIRTINECHHIIDLNITNSNPRGIGENLDNIEREARFANIALGNLQKNLQQLRDSIEADIRAEYDE